MIDKITSRCSSGVPLPRQVGTLKKSHMVAVQRSALFYVSYACLYLQGASPLRTCQQESLA